MTPQIDVPEVIPATLNDLEEIATFNARIHEDKRIKQSILDFIHFNKIPDIQRGFLLARNPENGEVISSCCLIPQNLRYGNIPIQAGNPEYIGTDEAFRRKGLISKQIDIMHQWSEENGDDLQFIGGIPNFYRQYGYEMTITMGNRRTDHLSVLDDIKAPENEVIFEEATENDIPDLIRLFGQENQTYLVTGDWSKQDWIYKLGNKINEGCDAELIYMLRRKNGTLIGAVRYDNTPYEKLFRLLAAEIDPVLATWDEVENAILIQLKELAEGFASSGKKPCKEIGLNLPKNHPLMVRCGYLFGRENKGYKWYIRVPNWLRFLNKVKPVIEENIHQSPYRGLSRTISISLYSSGMKIEFKKGTIVSIKPWQPEPHEKSDFRCPEQVFSHLVFGHRTIKEIKHLYVDCYGKKDAEELMDYCFPKRDSYLCPAI
jgi:hypothetical protein